VKDKWPAASRNEVASEVTFVTNIKELDSIFVQRGIPCGQLIEITGKVSSGKTSFLFRILAALTRNHTITYLDFSGSFFPSAAESSGVDLARVLVVKPDDFRAGLRTAELILRHRIACCVVFDLVRKSGVMSVAMMHRLRREAQKARSIMIFLTEDDSSAIPTSMISIKLEVRRIGSRKLDIRVAKGRITTASKKMEMNLDE
jgi:RecA/RadA recombinase